MRLENLLNEEERIMKKLFCTVIAISLCLGIAFGISMTYVEAFSKAFENSSTEDPLFYMDSGVLMVMSPVYPAFISSGWFSQDAVGLANLQRLFGYNTELSLFIENTDEVTLYLPADFIDINGNYGINFIVDGAESFYLELPPGELKVCFLITPAYELYPIITLMRKYSTSPIIRYSRYSEIHETMVSEYLEWFEEYGNAD